MPSKIIVNLETGIVSDVELTQEEINSIPVQTKEEIFAQTELRIQAMLDNLAQSWQYTDIVSASSYANSTVQQFKNEADVLIAYRDSLWTICYSIMKAINDGTQPMPSSIDAFIATLPTAPTRP